MTWIKLNDNVPRHPKIAGLSHRAFRAWVNGLCYASEFLTDGLLPVAFLVTVPRKVQFELLDGGLWCSDAAGTLSIHDYLKHQASKASVEQERRRNIARRTGGTTTGTPDGRTGEVPRPEIRDQRSEIPPNPPAGGFRIQREHLRQAEVIQRSWMGYCRHHPECQSQVECLKLIAREVAQKTKAS